MFSTITIVRLLPKCSKWVPGRASSVSFVEAQVAGVWLKPRRGSDVPSWKQTYTFTSRLQALKIRRSYFAIYLFFIVRYSL